MNMFGTQGFWGKNYGSVCRNTNRATYTPFGDLLLRVDLHLEVRRLAELFPYGEGFG